MGKRTTVALTFQGMQRKGDAAQLPVGKVRLISNCDVGIDGVKRRGSFRKVADQHFHSVPTGMSTGFKTVTLKAPFGLFRTKSAKSASLGPDDRVYILNGSVSDQGNYSYDGTSWKDRPFVTRVEDGIMVSGINRFFVGNASIRYSNILTPTYAIPSAAQWPGTNAGVSSTATGKLLTFTAADGDITLSTGIMGSGQWVTWQQHFLAASAKDVPLALQFIDAGGSVIAERDVLVSGAGRDEGWFRAGLSALMPDGVSFKLRIKAKGAAVNDAVYIGYMTPNPTPVEGEERGAQLHSGRFMFDNLETLGLYDATKSASRPGQIIWNETDTPSWWRAENYIRLSETPGPITAMAVNGKRLFAFKKDGMWLFDFTDNKNMPLSFVRFISEFDGPTEQSRVFVSSGAIYYATDTSVYRVSDDGQVTDLIPNDLLGYIVPKTTALDQIHKKLYVGSATSIMLVLDLQTGEWSQYKLPYAGTDVLHCVDGVLTFEGDISGLVELDPDGYVDDVYVQTQVSPPVYEWQTSAYESEVWSNAIEAGLPHESFSLEGVNIAHRITAPGSFILEASLDNGASWIASVTVTIGSSDLAKNDDTTHLFVPIRTTGSRMVLRMRCDVGRQNVFHVQTLEADMQIHGRAKRRAVSGS